MYSRFIQNVATFLALALAFSKVSADPTTFLKFTTDLSVAANPATGAIRGSGYYRDIYREEDSLLFKGAYRQVGIQISANPAFIQTGAHVEWMPITPFQLRVQYDYFRHLGDFGSLLDFDSPVAAYGDTVLAARRGTELTGSANRFSIHPTLRAKVGDFLVSNSTDYYFYYNSVDRPYFLERAFDILISRNGRLLTDRLVTLYDLKLPWATQTLLGPSYEYTRSINTDLVRQRVGFYLLQSFKTITFPNNSFRWTFHVAYNLMDRNRQGTLFVMLGVGSEFQL